MNHTKGEWSVDGHHLTAVITKDKPHKQIAICTINTERFSHSGIEINEAKANAKLIAAAPELLEALITSKETIGRLIKEYLGISDDLYKDFMGEMDNGAVMKNINNAINKATA